MHMTPHEQQANANGTVWQPSDLCWLKVLAKVSLAASVPAVSANQTLSAYTVDTFTKDVQDQVQPYILHFSTWPMLVKTNISCTVECSC